MAGDLVSSARPRGRWWAPTALGMAAAIALSAGPLAAPVGAAGGRAPRPVPTHRALEVALSDHAGSPRPATASAQTVSPGPGREQGAHDHGRRFVQSQSHARLRQSHARLTALERAGGGGRPAVFVPGCAPAPVLHSGETFIGTGCYATAGLTLRHLTDVVVDGGTWIDPSRNPGNTHGHGTAAGRPTFRLVGGSHITFENMKIKGMNRGGYHARLAFQSAIESEGTAQLTVSNVTVSHVFGDCLTLDPLRSGHGDNGIVRATTALHVNHFSGSACGRQGIALVSVKGAALHDVHIGTTGFESLDFEADTTGEGAEDVSVEGGSGIAPINISSDGRATGPITVDDFEVTGRAGDGIRIHNTTGRPDHGPITFDGDFIRCGASIYTSCFELHGASALTIANTTARLGFRHDALRESVYAASAHSHVLFQELKVSGFYSHRIGRYDSTSTVTMVSFRSR
jgi:hypothetical protein